jgi:hypothetical protein
MVVRINSVTMVECVWMDWGWGVVVYESNVCPDPPPPPPLSADIFYGNSLNTPFPGVYC